MEVDGGVGGGTGSARRRSCGCTGVTSSCRSVWPWLQQTHHSAQPRAKEEVEGETNDAPRRPKPPLLGKWPAPLEEVPQEKLGHHSGIHHELVLPLVVPVLQKVEQPVDASALSFFEEAEAKDLEVEYLELARTASHDFPALVERCGRSREEEEEEVEEAKASQVFLSSISSCSHGSHSEIWTSFLWFFLVFGVWVLRVESSIF